MVGTLLFIAVLLFVLVVLPTYLWWRLVRAPTVPGRTRRWLTALTVVVVLIPLTAGRLDRVVPEDAVTPLSWIAYSVVGVLLYLFLALLVLEPVRLGLRGWTRRPIPQPAPAPGAGVAEREPETVPSGARSRSGSEDAPARPDGQSHAHRDRPENGRVVDPSRRLFLARSMATTAGVVALSTTGAGTYFANSAPVVQRVPITLRGLDPAFDGFRIVTFSDGHLSETYGGRRFERLVEIVNAQRPDVVAVVGDLVDGEVDDLRDDVAPLSDLVSEQGVYFVTGNHEYFVDTRAWLRHLPTLGVEVLRNQRVPLRRGTATFDLAGIDDRTAAASGVPGHGADLDAALDGRDDNTPVVLLAHQPVQVAQAAAAGVDLQLSGHTHGGQLWPFDYVVSLEQPVVEGLSRYGDTQIYVTRGAGYWGPPMRVGARPEVTVVELRSPRT
ncbi:metallophosphoesterase [Modestobacter sp. KNN46-3]|jgi:predicted MPP superfamily phosphohydrolase|uniref:metallophosphoesterase n=1 Tax=Modestobacter sp. KNN46-3 TaxID=2711218 RepID=UPI0013DF5CC2|nr:metallophosphoesterase [Modestobacter sp. KNN46-3]